MSMHYNSRGCKMWQANWLKVKSFLFSLINFWKLFDVSKLSISIYLYQEFYISLILFSSFHWFQNTRWRRKNKHTWCFYRIYISFLHILFYMSNKRNVINLNNKIGCTSLKQQKYSPFVQFDLIFEAWATKSFLHCWRDHLRHDIWGVSTAVPFVVATFQQKSTHSLYS